MTTDAQYEEYEPEPEHQQQQHVRLKRPRRSLSTLIKRLARVRGVALAVRTQRAAIALHQRKVIVRVAPLSLMSTFWASYFLPRRSQHRTTRSHSRISQALV